MISSTLCGLSGILVALRMATATPSSGDGAELEALAATVIGGASLQGGIGTVLGAIVGSTIIRSIDVGLIVTRVDSNWFKFAVGGLLIVAVVFNTQIRQWARKIKIETKSTKEVA
jgi:ribose/xylose/arabinose/galactoside ABC-type transport system permease subunit